MKQLEKLVLSGTHFKHIVEESQDMIFSLNETGDFVYLNPAAALITGYTREELLKMNLFRIVSAEKREEVRAFIEDLVREKTTDTSIEFPIIRKDLRQIWLGLKLHCSETSSGLVVVSGIARDISDSIRQVKQLNNNISHLHVLIENMQAGVLVEDENRKIVLANRAFCDLFSVSLIPEDLIGKDYSYVAYFIRKLFSNQEEFRTHEESLISNRNIHIGQNIELTDGRTYERDYIPLYIETGYTGNLWKYRDTTEKNRIRNELIKSEKKYKSVIDTLQLGLLEVDKNDLIMAANEAFCRILEYDSVDDLIGKPAFQTLLDEDQQRVMTEQMAMREEGFSNAYEIKVKKANGGYAWMLISGAPLFDHNNNVIGSVGVHLDISYQKRIAIELEEKKAMQNLMEWQEKAMEHLEEKVIERTTEVVKQKEIIEDKNIEITNSINYALRIQQALLPDRKELARTLNECCVVYKPKDIVSGDFYYFCRHNEHSVYLAAADSTGHGVPGGFMSMLGSEKLHDAVQKGGNPGEILSLLNRSIKYSLRSAEGERTILDGFDVALVLLDTRSNMLRFAGAHRPVWIMRKNGEAIEEIRATKSAIGGWTDEFQLFETHQVQLEKGDTFYLFTDGFADQFGITGKRMMSRNFRKLLLTVKDMSMKEQEAYLHKYLDDWMGGEEQTDDILVIGVRV